MLLANAIVLLWLRCTVAVEDFKRQARVNQIMQYAIHHNGFIPGRVQRLGLDRAHRLVRSTAENDVRITLAVAICRCQARSVA